MADFTDAGKEEKGGSKKEGSTKKDSRKMPNVVES